MIISRKSHSRRTKSSSDISVPCATVDEDDGGPATDVEGATFSTVLDIPPALLVAGSKP